jgi:hypothetical protein
VSTGSGWQIREIPRTSGVVALRAGVALLPARPAFFPVFLAAAASKTWVLIPFIY